MIDNSANHIAVLVEGPADQRFIECFLCHIFPGATVNRKERAKGRLESGIVRGESSDGRATEIEVIPMGSYNLRLVHNQANRSKDEGKTVLILVDANGAVEVRREEIMSACGFLSKYVFLIPNNHESGELEDLLLKVIPERSQVFRECLDHYESCLKKANARGGPNKKGRLYAYREAVGAEASVSRVNYNNSEHWDIGHSSLEPLKKFLLDHLS